MAQEQVLSVIHLSSYHGEFIIIDLSFNADLLQPHFREERLFSFLDTISAKPSLVDAAYVKNQAYKSPKV